eukprot:Trichotokara_eunicae@DN6280_c0_g1_i4.p1
MHPQRIEILHNVFATQPDIDMIVTSFKRATSEDRNYMDKMPPLYPQSFVDNPTLTLEPEYFAANGQFYRRFHDLEWDPTNPKSEPGTGKRHRLKVLAVFNGLSPALGNAALKMRTVGKIDYPALPYFEDSNHMFKLVRHGYRMAFSKLQTTLYMRPGRTTLDENVAHKAKGGLGMDDNIEDCENAGGYMYCMLGTLYGFRLKENYLIRLILN